MFKNIQELLKKSQEKPRVKMTVAAAEDKAVLESVKMAHELNIVEPVLIGDEGKITSLLTEISYDYRGEIVATQDCEESAQKAMELIHCSQADFPMKGLLSSRLILKAMLDNKYNFRNHKLLSLITLMYLEKEERLVIITDGGMNISPDLGQKVEITKNAIDFAINMGIKKPRIAPLAAIEDVNPAMPATLDASALSKMADRGQIKNAVIDGPLAFDNAVSKDAALHKGIKSPVAGRADILLAPDIEAGNILYKSLIYYGGLPAASVIYGAKIPLVLTSRADSVKTKLNSIALAKVLYCKQK